MILGHIDHLDLVPYLPATLKQAIELIKQDVNAKTPNARYDIDGENVFYMVSDNKPRLLKDARPEFHQRYIDIQIVLEGEELFGICFQNAKQETMDEDNLADKDCAFVKTPANEVTVLLRAGDFAIFYPHELHKPLGFVDSNTTNIKKVVVKVALESLI